MRNLKTLTITVGFVAFALFFAAMILLMTSLEHLHDDPRSADAFILGATLLVSSMPFILLFQWLERKLTRLRRSELSQQGVPVTFL